MQLRFTHYIFATLVFLFNLFFATPNYAQKGGGGGGAFGSININQIRILPPDCQNPTATLLLQVSEGAPNFGLYPSYFVITQNSIGEQQYYLGITQNNIVVVSGVLLGTEIVGLTVCRTDYTLCSAFYTSTPFPTTINYPQGMFCIGTISPTNPSTCSGTGSLEISLSNGTVGDSYTVTLTATSTITTQAVLAANQSVTVANIPANYTVQQIEITHSTTGFSQSQSYNYTFTPPASPQFTVTPVEPTCTAGGQLQLVFSNGEPTETYHVTINGQSYGNQTAVNGTVTINNLPQGLAVQTVQAQSARTLCTTTSNYTHTFSSPQVHIQQVTLQQPTQCQGSGGLIIQLNNANLNTTYTLTLQTSSGVLMAHSQPANTTGQIVLRSTFGQNATYWGTISSIKVRRNDTQCEATWTTPLTFQNPPAPVAVSHILPANGTSCGEKGVITIVMDKVSDYELSYMVNMPYLPWQKSYSYGSNQVSTLPLSNGYWMGGQVTIKDLRTQCETTYQLPFHTYQAPNIKPTFGISPPSSCQARDGRLGVGFDAMQTYPAVQEGELFDIEVYTTSLTGASSTQSAYNLTFTNGALFFPYFFANGDMLQTVKVTRKGNGSTLQACSVTENSGKVFSVYGFPTLRTALPEEPNKCDALGGLKLRLRVEGMVAGHSYKFYVNNSPTPSPVLNQFGEYIIIGGLSPQTVTTVKVVNETLGCATQPLLTNLVLVAPPTPQISNVFTVPSVRCGATGELYFTVITSNIAMDNYLVYLNGQLVHPNNVIRNGNQLSIKNFDEQAVVSSLRVVSQTTDCSQTLQGNYTFLSNTPLRISAVAAEPILNCGGTAPLYIALENAIIGNTYTVLLNGTNRGQFVFQGNPLVIDGFTEGATITTAQVQEGTCSSTVWTGNVKFVEPDKPLLGTPITQAGAGCGLSTNAAQFFLPISNATLNEPFAVSTNLGFNNQIVYTQNKDGKIGILLHVGYGEVLSQVKVTRDQTCSATWTGHFKGSDGRLIVTDVRYQDPTSSTGKGIMEIYVQRANGAALSPSATEWIALKVNNNVIWAGSGETVNAATLKLTVDNTTTTNPFVIAYTVQSLSVSIFNSQTGVSSCESDTYTDWAYMFNYLPPCTTATPVPSTATINYIETVTVLKEGEINETNIANLQVKRGEKKVVRQYFDGLGRPVQVIDQGASPQGRDVVSFEEYDEFGRTRIKFLPYTINALSNGTTVLQNGFRRDAKNEQCAFYQGEPTIQGAWTAKPFAETVFEASPLNRVLAQGAAGESWQYDKNLSLDNANQHLVVMNQYPNAANTVRWLEISTTALNSSSNIVNKGYYAAGELWATETIDENKQGKVVEYKDKGGKVVQKVVSSLTTNEVAITYYLYDDFDRLRVVIQPEGMKLVNGQSNNFAFSVVEKYAFAYNYDKRGRITEKYVPGTGVNENFGEGRVSMVYDQLDRVVATQDGNQRAKQEWTYTKYDVLSRPIQTGLLNTATLPTPTALFESRVTGESPNSPTHGYTNTYWQSGKVLSVTYYDSYEGVPAELAAPNDPAIHKDIHGKPAFSKTAVLNNTNTAPTVWEWGVSYADWRGRVLYALSRDRHQRTDKVQNTYSNTGLLLRTESYHAPYQSALTPLQMTQRHEYDHAGRLLRLYMTVTGRGGQYDGREQLLAAYRYNELGQLSSKSQHGKATGGFIQTQRFSYNVRGWLTKLNDIATVQSGTGTKGDLFAFTLYYNTLPVNSIVAGGTAQYNGNIAAQSWVSRRDGVERGFTYQYDWMNRLVSSNYVASNPIENNNYSTAHSYDLNGNIKTTYRRGVIQMTTPTNGVPSFTYGEMDKMRYDYANSNRLTGVQDFGTATQNLPDFNDNGSTGVDYAYDHNGNLTKDSNKKIATITYNHLNLPTFIDFGTKGSISYEYNAAGAKLRKTVTETGKPSKTTDYIGGLVYENNVLQFVPTAEGRMVNSVEKGLLYQYHYKDHLGNVRMTFAPDVPVKETLRLTAEADSAAKESQDFSNLVVSRTAEDAAEGWYSVALAKSKGSISSRVLKVVKGDQLSLSARATYDQEKIATLAEGNTPANRWGSVAVAASGLLAVQDVTIGGETKSKSLNFNFLAAIPFVKTLLSKTKNKDDITIPYKVAQPKGYVEIALYKDSTCREYLYSKHLPITDKGAYFWEFLQDSVSFDTDGFAVVSLRNESDKAVLFDDLRVDLFGTAEAIIVQENHYEPFGMTLRGLDYVLEERQKNRFLYNDGTERTEDLDLLWDETPFRPYDKQLGRFTGVDKLADFMRTISSYSFGFNNPISYNDPTGLIPPTYEEFLTQVYQNSASGTKYSGDELSKAYNIVKQSGEDTNIDVIQSENGVSIHKTWGGVEDGVATVYSQKLGDLTSVQEKSEKDYTPLMADLVADIGPAIPISNIYWAISSFAVNVAKTHRLVTKGTNIARDLANQPNKEDEIDWVLGLSGYAISYQQMIDALAPQRLITERNGVNLAKPRLYRQFGTGVFSRAGTAIVGRLGYVGLAISVHKTLVNEFDEEGSKGWNIYCEKGIQVNLQRIATSHVINVMNKN